MSKTIVIVGATGMQGGSVAETFLHLPDWKVRGITRNPSSEAAQALAAKGVEVVQGDLDDDKSLERAFKGATAIFGNTDFFTHLFYIMSNPDKLPTGSSAGKYAYDREVAQNINIAKAAASPTVIKTLEKFVLSSLTEARKWSGGKYTTVYHFDSKAEAVRLIRERYPEVAAKMSTVQGGNYVTNWRAFHKLAPQKQSDGSFVLTRTSSPTFRMPLFVAHRDTGAFVKALVDMAPGKDLLAVSEYMTFPEWVDIWARVHGVKATYKQVTSEELFQGAPEILATELRDGFDFIEDFGFTGGDPNVLEPEQLDVKLPLTSMEEYIRSEDWSTILSPGN